MVRTINKSLGSNSLSEAHLRTSFDIWWPQLEDAFKALPPPELIEKDLVQVNRSERDILEEILRLVRGQTGQPNMEERAESNKVEALLSLREREVLKLLVHGMTYQEIGEALYLSVHTVKSHAQHIKEKLGVTNRVGLLKVALGLNEIGG
jgi:DNA-binding NarL/FixJ family response regulator